MFLIMFFFALLAGVAIYSEVREYQRPAQDIWNTAHLKFFGSLVLIVLVVYLGGVYTEIWKVIH